MAGKAPPPPKPARRDTEPASSETTAETRAERRRRQKARAASAAAAQPSPAAPVLAGPWSIFRARTRTSSFRAAAGWLVLGFLVVLLSQTLPHDYGFLELGWLFTLSVYDLVLAMLGLSVALALTPSRRISRAIVIVFAAVLLPMLIFFDEVFAALRDTVIGANLFLVAPVAVIFTGLMLWLPGRLRDLAAPVAAAIVAFSLSLFVGLDDLGVGIADFASGALFCALWLVTAPGLMLRQFPGEWLRIPARILGSWLVVIGIVVMVSLYIPAKPVAPPPPGPDETIRLGLPDGTTIEVPPEEAEEQ